MAQTQVSQEAKKKPRQRIRKSGEDRAVDAVVFLIMAIVFIAIVYPFYYCIVISFNNGIDASMGGIFFYPRKFSMENYIAVFKNESILPAYGMTILRTLVGTCSTLLFTGLVAYALSHRDLVFRGAYMRLLIIAMYFSGGLIPFYVLLRSLRLLNTFGVYVIPSLFGIWNCILMINFFKAIPDSLAESAKIDGANELTIFFRIIVPVSLPLFATIALYVGVGHWNDWYTTSFFAQQNRALRTLAYELKEIISRANLTSIAAKPGMDQATAEQSGMAASKTYTAETLRMATMIVVILPIMCVYPFLQKYFVKGVMVGSIKG